jgi:hypothetical protein
MEQLRDKIKKKRSMVRKVAPVTIESTGLAKLSYRIERICYKIKCKIKL